MRDVATWTDTFLHLDNFEAILFYTTFMTSIWIWLSVSGWLFVKYAANFQTVLRALQFALPIKTKPMRAIGEAAALVAVFIILIVGAFGD